MATEDREKYDELREKLESDVKTLEKEKFAKEEGDLIAYTSIDEDLITENENIAELVFGGGWEDLTEDQKAERDMLRDSDGLKKAFQVREDYIKDYKEIRMTDNTRYVFLEYKADITGSKETEVGVEANDYNASGKEKYRSIFKDIIASGSGKPPRSTNFTRTNAQGGEVISVKIKNQNPFQAPIILVVSGSATA
jgi:hypothetical protein